MFKFLRDLAIAVVVSYFWADYLQDAYGEVNFILQVSLTLLTAIAIAFLSVLSEKYD